MKRRYKSKESPFQTEKVIKKIEYMSQFEGLNDREIAEKFHCCRATLNRVRRNNNIAKCNIMNKKDKYFICCFCGEKVYVKRRDLNSFMCRKCENKVEDGLITKEDIINLLNKHKKQQVTKKSEN